MSSNFDYNHFKAQHELRKAIKGLTTALREATDDHDDPIFQAEDGANRPFENLLRTLNITDEAAPAAEFDFEHNGLTLREVEDRCAEDHLDFMAVTQQRGPKTYFNQACNNQPAQWVEISRPEASDSTQELSELIFLDTQKGTVDWIRSLANLKRLGLDRRYTADMMKTALLKIVNRFLPGQIQLLKDKTANDFFFFFGSPGGFLVAPFHHPPGDFTVFV